MLNTAVKAARKAGAIINRASLDIDRVRISRKDRNDFVTEVDEACERVIIETLTQAYPSHGFLGRCLFLCVWPFSKNPLSNNPMSYFLAVHM